jgi:hypothetical protein
VYAPVCVDGAPPEAAIIPVRIRERLGGELRGVVAPG